MMATLLRHPLARVLAAWVCATALACLLVHRAFALSIDEEHPLAVVASVWSGGQVVGRAVLAHTSDHDARLDAALAAHPGATLVDESVVADGPVLLWPPVAFALSVVPGRDGLSAAFEGRVGYLTPDELLVLQAYDRGMDMPGGLGVQAGLDVPLALRAPRRPLGDDATDLVARGAFAGFGSFARSRERLRRASSPHGPRVDEDVRAAAVEAGRFLARGVDASGRFRYLIDAPSNRTLSGYDWPRHAGATYFLAEVAALSHDENVSFAALRAASWLRDHALVDCGADRCIGSDDVVDVGSTALAVIAFVEIARTNLDPGYALLVPGLTSFLRARSSVDGEFMHEYDRRARRPIGNNSSITAARPRLPSRARTHSWPTGATSKLRRARSRISSARDGAFSGVGIISGKSTGRVRRWTIFGTALRTLVPWTSAFAGTRCSRKLQYSAGDTAYDADGAYGFGPVITARLTPVGSRSEAGIATLERRVVPERRKTS